MQPFAFVHADSVDDALATGGRDGARYIAGGTTLVDLMRLEVMRPRSIVDITGLPLTAIEDMRGGVRIGALATNTGGGFTTPSSRRYARIARIAFLLT